MSPDPIEKERPHPNPPLSDLVPALGACGRSPSPNRSPRRCTLTATCTPLSVAELTVQNSPMRSEAWGRDVCGAGGRGGLVRGA